MRTATNIEVLITEQKVKDYSYLTRVEEITDLLPHGSGFDGDWVVEEDTENRYFSNSYHAMDGNGFYSGWLHFTLVVEKRTPSRNWYKAFDIEWDDSDLDYDAEYEVEYEDSDY